MSNYQKKLVTVELATLYLDGYTLKSALEQIQEYIRNYGEDATISEENYGYEDGKYLAIFEQKLETDEQFNARIQTEEYFKKQREDRERMEFERLKAKYKE